MKKVKLFVSGRVQGVFYRASTQEEATKLGLTGWVRNLDDGRVEIEACGPLADVQKIIDWCHQGPKNAVVEDVAVKWLEDAGELTDGFKIL